MELAPYADCNEYDSDITRVVYSNAYKRLAHKTQIIIKPTRDHFRSRLTHTEEVNQIALSLGKKLALNQELITAIAKAHDLGHTPFGHAGERTMQQILERDLIARFKINYPKKESEKDAFRRSIFHHSLNSARMLIKEKEFEDVSMQVINGVLNHSWSPWKENKKAAIIPETYEAQVVATADQIASINHDTEDIIEGEPYTEYDSDRFITELINGFKNNYPESYKKLTEQNEIISLFNPMERGYGRQKRVEIFITKITQSTIESIKNNEITQKEQATSFPICIPQDWSNFLLHYEKFIRNLIQEKISWFVARDNMAGALISTVFNHIWPRARESASITQMKIPIYKDSELIKSKYVEKTKYIEHFSDFFNQHYIEEKSNTNYYKKYLDEASRKKVIVWDINIQNAFKDTPTPDEQRLLTRLVAVIDFIAGLTDRYCLEMFDEVYQDFVIT